MRKLSVWVGVSAFAILGALTLLSRPAFASGDCPFAMEVCKEVYAGEHCSPVGCDPIYVPVYGVKNEY